MDDASFMHTLVGAVDAHVHIKDHAGLAAIRAAGVVAVRDAGTKDGAGLKTAALDGPRVVSAGWALFKRGGYGGQFGVPVEGRGEMRAEIRKLADAGAGILKIMASGMVSLKERGTITPGGFDRDELAFMVGEADSMGLGVMAHANGEAAIAAAAAAGVRSVEHGFFMSETALAMMREHGVFWVPTVGALQRAAGAAGVSKDVGVFITTTIDAHLTMIRRAFDQGVPLAIGTDCVLPDQHYREVYASEIRCFLRAGLPHDAVQRIACEGGRLLLGI